MSSCMLIMARSVSVCLCLFICFSLYVSASASASVSVTDASQCADVCAMRGEGADPYCVWDAAHQAWVGVNMTRLLTDGNAYLRQDYPSLDTILHAELV